MGAGAGVTSWEEARRLAASWPALPACEVAVADAAGLVLAVAVVATTDLPAFDASAMDGWAVAGPPPWQVVGPGPEAVRTGEAAQVATGSRVPTGADAVLRDEHAVLDRDRLRPAVDPGPASGADIRRQGSECRAGDVVATASSVATPPLLGLAAAAGIDRLAVVRRPVVDVLVTGEEVVAAGQPPAAGAVRDALGPMVPAWLRSAGVTVGDVRHLGDDADALAATIRTSAADLVVTTGSTARGSRDHLHAVLRSLGAELVVDGVAVRPGHPMLLARLADGRPLVGLPGNPLAAASALVTLALPALAALAGRSTAGRRTVVLRADVSGPADDVRLIPVRGGRPALHVGPAMLRGLAEADGIAVVPPGGAPAGTEVELLG
jgi:molybdopterin molybdotransferase